ncbi:hypothetical protein MKW92_007540, partial [Papaver armeniacum]
IEAGTPEDYYLDPSDNLMKITSDWSVVEHEDVLELTFNMFGIGERVFVVAKQHIIYIVVDVEDKETGAARFEHKDGMKNFSIEMNPKFLNFRIKNESWKMSKNGIGKLFVNKFKLKEKGGRISDLD